MFVEEKEQGEQQVTELDEASKLLLKAADLIESDGLAKNMLCDGAKHCVRGAMIRAAGYTPNTRNSYPANGITWGTVPAGTAIREADKRLWTSLGKEPPDWNNAAARTQKQVVAKLRAVALGL